MKKMKKRTAGHRRILAFLLAAILTILNVPIVSRAETITEKERKADIVIDLEKALKAVYKTEGMGIEVENISDSVLMDIEANGEIIAYRGKSGSLIYLVTVSLSNELDMDALKEKSVRERNLAVAENIMTMNVIVLNNSKNEKNYVIQFDDKGLCESVSYDGVSSVDIGEDGLSQGKVKEEFNYLKTEIKEETVERETEIGEELESRGEAADQENPETDTSKEEMDDAAKKEVSDSIENEDKNNSSDNAPQEGADVEDSSKSDNQDSDTGNTNPESENGEKSDEGSGDSGNGQNSDVGNQDSTNEDMDSGNQDSGNADTDNKDMEDSGKLTISRHEVFVLAEKSPDSKATPSDATPAFAEELEETEELKDNEINAVELNDNFISAAMGSRQGARFSFRLQPKEEEKYYKAYTKTGNEYSIRVIEEGIEYIAYCHNYSKPSPDKNSLFRRLTYEEAELEGYKDINNLNKEEIINLLYAGYPYDSMGLLQSDDMKEINNGLAFILTQEVLWYLCGKEMIVPENPQTPSEKYTVALLEAAKDDSVRVPIVTIKGDTEFKESNGIFQTGLLKGSSKFGGTYTINELPEGYYLVDQDGDKIDLGTELTLYMDGFRICTNKEPASEEIIFYINYEYQQSDIYLYEPVVDENYQNIVRLNLMDQTDNIQLKASFIPGEDPSVTPEPDHKPEEPEENVPETPEENVPETPEEIIPDNPDNSSDGSPDRITNSSSDGNRDYGIPESTEEPENVIILDNDVPLAILPETSADTVLEIIDDGDIPLAGLPKTGEQSGRGKILFLFAGLLGGLYVAQKNTQRNKG